MICSMTLENYLPMWPPLGKILMLQEVCVLPYNIFTLCSFIKSFTKKNLPLTQLKGRPYNVAARGSRPACISQGKCETRKNAPFQFLVCWEKCLTCVTFSSHKEERWFSGELKKELDKVQGHLKQVIPFRCFMFYNKHFWIWDIKENSCCH